MRAAGRKGLHVYIRVEPSWDGFDVRRAAVTVAREMGRFHADLDDGIPDAPWPPVYPKMPDEAPRVAPSRARDPD